MAGLNPVPPPEPPGSGPVGEGGTPVAKAALWAETDDEARKLGERTGLDTMVVPAVKDGR